MARWSPVLPPSVDMGRVRQLQRQPAGHAGFDLEDDERRVGYDLAADAAPRRAGHNQFDADDRPTVRHYSALFAAGSSGNIRPCISYSMDRIIPR